MGTYRIATNFVVACIETGKEIPDSIAVFVNRLDFTNATGAETPHGCRSELTWIVTNSRRSSGRSGTRRKISKLGSIIS